MEIRHILGAVMLASCISQACHADWIEPDRHDVKETLARLSVEADLIAVVQPMPDFKEINGNRFYGAKIVRILATTWDAAENDKYLGKLSAGTCIYVKREWPPKGMHQPLLLHSGFNNLCWLKIQPVSDEEKKDLEFSVCYTAAVPGKSSVQTANVPESREYAQYLKILNSYKKISAEIAQIMEENKNAESPKNLRLRFGVENLTAEQVLNCTSAIAKLMSAEKNNEAELAKLAKSDDPLMACTAAFLLSNHKDKIQRFKYVESTLATKMTNIPKTEPPDKTKTTPQKKSP